MSAEEFSEKIQQALAVLPDKPGVYLMHDANGKVIYVGKAVVLKNRVRSYFRNLASHTPKVKAMVEKIAEIETIVTSSEEHYTTIESVAFSVCDEVVDSVKHILFVIVA